MKMLLLQLLALASLSSAHFILEWPTTAGFDDDAESTEPCGSFTPMVNDNSPQVQVDQFAISIKNVHPVGEWSFRGTIDTQAPYNFTEIVPIVNTTGIGDFCLQYMSVPSDWAGKAGILQVVDNSPDGILYQCAPVNFVSGSNTTAGSSCTNSSSDFTATWTSLQSFQGEAPGDSSGTTSGSSSGTSAGASSTSSGVAAVVTGVGALVGGLGLVAAGLVF